MNNTETLTTSDVVSFSVLFLLFSLVFIFYCVLCIRYCQCLCVVPSVYASVYFVLCLVYPMLSVSLCCSFCLLWCLFCTVSCVSEVVSVSAFFVLDCQQQRIHKTKNKINTRVNRRDNQEWKHRDTDNIGYTLILLHDMFYVNILHLLSSIGHDWYFYMTCSM
jgi:membrane protein implicated in regulation of membrane protease activity